MALMDTDVLYRYGRPPGCSCHRPEAEEGENHMIKRIVTIQDISCVGKCSLTVALPIISAMGVETAILPTAVLSTHTMFQGFTCKDLTDQIAPIAEHWKHEHIAFDAIYTGYLGSFEQISLVSKFFDEFKTEDNLIVVDPVMADNGKLYPAFDEAYAKENTKLCSKADLIVPNLTEASFMTGLPYKTEYDRSYIAAIHDDAFGLPHQALEVNHCFADKA